ncbi:uncharacterized protein LOC121878072 [Homarus americanus]|uniref:Uncharacterized protein n=1 Tax=Homarus americanus TaxID=6706 RepID=A0A8J5JTJ0_HOMAM|nr:uncharacterized protein LOC121878072 [Homarus americanus]KAG7158934.1 hypothetical protein Hamer_G006312 [Homarus americanus]
MRFVLVACVVASVVVGSTAQRPRIKIPSRIEMQVALQNPVTVDKALRCIEGLPCELPDSYAPLLRHLGPELILRRECPRRLCTPAQAKEAKWLMAQIQRRYPRKFNKTINTLLARNPHGFAG